MGIVESTQKEKKDVELNVEACWRILLWCWLYNTMNILKAIELYSLNGWIVMVCKLGLNKAVYIHIYLIYQEKY